MAAEFEQLGEVVIHAGPVFTVSTGQVRTPDGEVVTRDYVRHPGAVVVVPLIGTTAVMVRQYRAAIDTHLLELPAGKRDVADEPPDRTAARELREEVGLEASSLTLLARFYNTPGFSDEYSWCYLATGCTEVPSERQGVEEQHMTIERVPLAEVPALIERGELDDAKSIIGLLLARATLGLG